LLAAQPLRGKLEHVESTLFDRALGNNPIKLFQTTYRGLAIEGEDPGAVALEAGAFINPLSSEIPCQRYHLSIGGIEIKTGYLGFALAFSASPVGIFCLLSIVVIRRQSSYPMVLGTLLESQGNALTSFGHLQKS
jgi:hypothetical protein